MISKKTLSNNITFVSHYLENASSCAIGFYFSVGSRMEGEGEHGISHFTEHLLFKGTLSRTTHDIACTFDRLGGMVNAFTEKDSVCAYSVVPALDSSPLTALDLLCDMSENCIFPAEEIERERAVVLNEIFSVEDDAEESALEEAARLVWKNQSLSRSITGSQKEVSALKREDIIRWYEKYFKTGELLVIAAGKFDPLLVEERLLKLPLHKKSLAYPQELHDKNVNYWTKGTLFAKAKFTQCQLYTLYPFSMPISYADYCTLLVFNSLMGESMSSRLCESLREKSGLCYSVYSFFSCYEDTAFWAVFVSCEKKNVLPVVSKLKKEIESVKENISDGEIEAAKAHILGEEFLGGTDTEFLLRRHQRHLAMGFSLMETEEILSCIRSVRKNDIINLVNKLLAEENRTFLSYGPSLPAKVKKECL